MVVEWWQLQREKVEPTHVRHVVSVGVVCMCKCVCGGCVHVLCTVYEVRVRPEDADVSWEVVHLVRVPTYVYHFVLPWQPNLDTCISGVWTHPCTLTCCQTPQGSGHIHLRYQTHPTCTVYLSLLIHSRILQVQWHSGGSTVPTVFQPSVLLYLCKEEPGSRSGESARAEGL